MMETNLSSPSPSRFHKFFLTFSLPWSLSSLLTSFPASLGHDQILAGCLSRVCVFFRLANRRLPPPSRLLIRLPPLLPQRHRPMPLLLQQKSPKMRLRLQPVGLLKLAKSAWRPATTSPAQEQIRLQHRLLLEGNDRWRF